MTTRVYQIKHCGKYIDRYTSTGEDALHSLASELAAKYIGKAAYIRSIKRVNNFDGTKTYTVTYASDCGGGRSIYTTDIY